MKSLFFVTLIFSSASFACPDLSGKYSCLREGKGEVAFEYSFNWAASEKLYVGSIQKKNGNVHMMKFATTGEWIANKDFPGISRNTAVKGVCEAASFTSFFRTELKGKDGKFVSHSSETKYFKDGKNLIEETKEVTGNPPVEKLKKMVCTPLA